jgi:membrane fusion protein (multidrug efflux system)
VIANYKETQVGKMRPGQRATIEIDAYPHREFEGKVESLSGGTGSSFSLLPADNASGNFVKVVQRVPVRIAWINLPPDVALRAGLSVDAVVEVGK